MSLEAIASSIWEHAGELNWGIEKVMGEGVMGGTDL
jgi:hypothetical protein